MADIDRDCDCWLIGCGPDWAGAIDGLWTTGGAGGAAEGGCERAVGAGCGTADGAPGNPGPAVNEGAAVNDGVTGCGPV